MNKLDSIAEEASQKVFRYPKFTLLLFTIFVAYLLFESPNMQAITQFFVSLNYFGIFLLGFFFAYGFTAAPATAIFMHLSGDFNIYLASLVGGVGAYVGDYLIFLFIRQSFKDEVRKLKHERILTMFKMKIPDKFRKVLYIAFGGFVLASPLPDELGVALLAASTDVSKRLFAVISIFCNAAGIYVSLLIGSLL
jgi:hypothetical protein